jgi:hypothetical protein
VLWLFPRAGEAACQGSAGAASTIGCVGRLGIDRGHHHEALHMAEQAQDNAKEIEVQIPLQRPGDA